MLDREVRRLSIGMLAERSRSLPYLIYVNTAAIIKSGVAVISVQVMMDMLKQETFPLHAFILWLLSILLAGMTFITWLRGSLFVTSRIGLSDFYIPALVGLFELTLFLICDPENVGLRILGSMEARWLCVLGLHAWSATLLVASRRYLTEKVDFDHEISHRAHPDQFMPLADLYLRWMTGDIIGSFLLGSLAIVAAFLAPTIARHADFNPSILSVTIACILVIPTFLIVNIHTLMQLHQIERSIFRRGPER